MRHSDWPICLPFTSTLGTRNSLQESPLVLLFDCALNTGTNAAKPKTIANVETINPECNCRFITQVLPQFSFREIFSLFADLYVVAYDTPVPFRAARCNTSPQ